MARVTLVGNLAQLAGGVAEYDLPVTSVKQLFEQLAERHPMLGRHLEEGVLEDLAVDGDRHAHLEMRRQCGMALAQQSKHLLHGGRRKGKFGDTPRVLS